MKFLSYVSKCFEVHSAGVSRFGCSAIFSAVAFSAHLLTLHWLKILELCSAAAGAQFGI